MTAHTQKAPCLYNSSYFADYWITVYNDRDRKNEENCSKDVV